MVKYITAKSKSHAVNLVDATGGNLLTVQIWSQNKEREQKKISSIKKSLGQHIHGAESGRIKPSACVHMCLCEPQQLRKMKLTPLWAGLQINILMSLKGLKVVCEKKNVKKKMYACYPQHCTTKSSTSSPQAEYPPSNKEDGPLK